MINGVINAIRSATTNEGIEELKQQILSTIGIFQTGKAEGDAAGYARGQAEALGSMGTEQNSNAVKVTKGDKTVILYGPDKVEFIKVSTEE